MNSLRVDFGVEKCMDKVFKLGQMVHDMRKINQTPLKFIFVMSCVQFDSTQHKVEELTVGQYKDDKMHGSGSYTASDGSRYEEMHSNMLLYPHEI